MSKFVFMVNMLLEKHTFVIDGQLVTKAEASDAGRSVWFWMADGSGVQVPREAFSAMEVVAPDHLESRNHTHIVRDSEGKPHTFVAMVVETYEFTNAARNTMWDWD